MKKLIVFFILSFMISPVFSQQDTSLPRRIHEKELAAQFHTALRAANSSLPQVATSPEQDCNSAIPVCQNTYSTSVSYSGSGNSQEIPSNSCLGSNELNSVWYTFSTSSSGNLAFNITPNSSSDDYDFALYDITGSNCSGISSGAITPVRCNYSATSGVTGLSSSGSNASESASGPNQSSVLATTPGKTYVLIISNYSSSQSGYVLNFSPGTASIFDNTPPTPQSVTAPCGATSVTFNASEQIKCSSVASNGSDFTVSGTGGPYTVSGASGVNCGTNTGQVTVNISPALSGAGPWTIGIQSGSDGNTLIDACGNAMAATTMTFSTSPPSASIAGPTSVCKGTVFALTASNGTAYNWTGSGVPAGQAGQQTISVTPSTPGTLNFTVQVTNGSCGNSVATHAVTITDSPVANFSAVPSLTVCAGTPVTFTNTSTYPCSSFGLGINQCTCGSFGCQATSNMGTFATYLWTFGNGGTAFYIAGTPATNFSPAYTYTAPGSYVVSLSASGLINTCSSIKNLTVTVLPAAASLTISPSVTICPSQNTTLTVSGGSSYTWTPSTALSSTSSSTVTANPAVTTTYTVTAPGCSGTQSKTVTVTVNGVPPAIGAIQGPASVCNNATGITYSVTGVAATNYTWTVPAGVTIASGAGTNAITVNYSSSAGTISVTASTACGTSTASLAVTISPALSLTVTPGSTSICPGGTATLTVSGASTYTWSPAGTISPANGSTVTANPAATTIYTVNGSSGTCAGSATAQVTVGSSLAITVSQSNPGSCSAASATLVAGGAASYSWAPSASLSAGTGSTVVASPAATTIYTITGANGACTGTATAMVSIGPSLSATVTHTNVSCNGLSDGAAAANPSGAPGPYTYAWSSVPAQTTQTATGLPAGIYTVTIGSTQCSASGLELVANGDFSAGNTGFSSSYTYTPPPNTVEGQYWVGTGAQVSSWNGGMFSSGDHTSGTGNFMLVNGANAPNTDVFCETITVNPNTDYLFSTWVSSLNSSLPAQLQFNINGAPLGSVFTSPAGPNVWTQFFSTWNSGSNTSISICIINQNNSSVGNDFGLDDISFQQCLLPCPITQTVTITEPPAVTLTVSSNTTICSGQSTSLVAGGATSYTWSPAASLGAANTATVSATPSVTTVYTVTGADAGGCTSTTTVQVSVSPGVTLTLTPASVSVCPGVSATLTAAGASTYTWSPSATLSSANGNTISATPVATTIYSVTGTNTAGCMASATATVNMGGTISITVNPATATVCPSSTLSLNASGASTYTWSPSATLSLANGASVTALPTGNTVYTVTGESSGCSGTNTISVTVSNTLMISASAANATICPGASTSLTANGAAGYTWTPAASLSSGTGNAVTATPAASTQYTVLGATGTCTNTTTVDLTVAPLPTITISASPTICSGSSAPLTAGGANTYTWLPASGLSLASGANVSASPNATTSYTVSGSSVAGCTSNTVVTVNVTTTPTLTALSSHASVCDGNTAVLSGFGASSYTWSPSVTLSGANSSTVTATPQATTIYTLTGENGTAPNACASSATVQLQVIPQTTAVASPSQSVCLGSRTYMVASGGTSYTWTPAAGLSNPHSASTYASPSINTTYTVTVSSGQCPGTATTGIMVNPLPAVNAGSDTTINIDEKYELIGTGEGSLGWLPVDVPYACNYCAQETVNPQNNTCYVLEATNAFGCVSRDTMCITVTKDWDVFIPNAFTPNGNNVNDVFLPVGYGIKEIHLFIFDRWGEQIFKSSDTQQGWDGKNKGKLCETGVYIYQVEINTMAGPTYKRVGHVTLLSSVK